MITSFEIMSRLREDYFRDSIYSRYYSKELSEFEITSKELTEKLIEKGFFFSEYTSIKDMESDYLLDDYTTHVFPLSNMKKEKKNIFLLLCGGFSPYHEGHHSMFEKAITKLTSLGYHVSGCYISPSHDDYVNSKRNGEAKLNAFERIKIAEEYIKEVNNKHLYAVDKWESTLCRKTLNYTNVLLRTQAYLNNKYKGLGYEFDVLPIYGSDNIGFADVLEANEKNSVVIMRGEDKIAKDYAFAFQIDEESNNISSTSLRKNGEFKEPSYDHIEGIYEIRDDLSYATIGLGLSNLKLNRFRTQFNSLIKEVLPKNLIPTVIPLDSQINKLDNSRFLLPTISLDTYYEGDYNKGVSRVFDISNDQFKANKLVPRDKHKLSLKEYLSDIKNGSYVIIDDDSASGYTLNTIKSNLPPNVNTPIFQGLNDLWRKNSLHNMESYDIVDLRDFVIGSQYGGLLVENHLGVTFRVPYIFPYVNLYSRATILPEHHKEFTSRILQMNRDLYEYSNKKLSDFDESSIKWLLEIGYEKDDYIEVVLIKEILKLSSNR